MRSRGAPTFESVALFFTLLPDSCSRGESPAKAANWIGGQVRRRKKAPETRGLTRSHNRTLKYVFKGAALTASRCEPFKTWYAELPGVRFAPAAREVAGQRVRIFSFPPGGSGAILRAA